MHDNVSDATLHYTVQLPNIPTVLSSYKTAIFSLYFNLQLQEKGRKPFTCNYVYHFYKQKAYEQITSAEEKYLQRLLPTFNGNRHPLQAWLSSRELSAKYSKAFG
jgi:hypothetical protein